LDDFKNKTVMHMGAHYTISKIEQKLQNQIITDMIIEFEILMRYFRINFIIYFFKFLYGFIGQNG